MLNERLLIGNFTEVLMVGQNSTINFNEISSMQLSNINKVNIEGLNFNGVTTLSVLISIISECHLVNLKLLSLKLAHSGSLVRDD